MTEDEMVGWHCQINGHEFEQALGVSGGQGSLVCCSPLGSKELDMTHQLSTHTHTNVYTILKIFHYRINWKRPSLEKTLMLGKIEGKRRRGQQG